VSHPLHTDFREKSQARRAIELYRRRLVRTGRQRTELQNWLEKGGMGYSFRLVKKAYEQAFFADDTARVTCSFPLHTPRGSAGFAFTLEDFMPAHSHLLVLDCLMAQISAMAGFHPVKAERWIARDEELGCDYHQCYTFRPSVGLLRRWVNALTRRAKEPVLFLSGIQRNGCPPRIELLWKGPEELDYGLHSMMERWLHKSPDGLDFSYLYKRKHLINRLWK